MRQAQGDDGQDQVAQFDLPLALGATVYSVLIVLPLMLVLAILQAVVDPRIREGVA